MFNDNASTTPTGASRTRRRGLATTIASAAVLGAVAFGAGGPAEAAAHTPPAGTAAIFVTNQALTVHGIAWDHQAFRTPILTCAFDNNRPLACTRTNGATHLFALRATLSPGMHRIRIMAYNAGNNTGSRAIAAQWKIARAAAPNWLLGYSGYQRTAASMLASYGWGRDQMAALIALWNRESGWNPLASNGGSGAYGIPQALPGSKMASAGADWRTNGATQIRWGLSYIRGVYGSPTAAWAHSRATGWY